MNFLGVTAVGLSLGAFALAHSRLRPRAAKVRCAWFGGLALLAVPSLLFAVYYLRVLPEWAWFYTLRSWPGTELLVVFLGAACGAAASLLPRLLLGVPLFVLLAPAVLPYVKPLLGPIPDDAFQESWQGDVCLQSTPSTCGPASVTTILRHLGAPVSERTVARAAFSYTGGTEAWYLARYVRTRGFVARFDFRSTFSPAAGLPCMVGVRLGGVGHFIAVLEVNGDQVAVADPCEGPKRVSLSAFQRRYDFTGFHLVISPPQPYPLGESHRNARLMTRPLESAPKGNHSSNR